MEKFLIEIQNGGDRVSCLRSIQSFLSSRTHYVTSVEWGCLDEENKAWLIIETGKREDALRIIPATYRQSAKITKLQPFNCTDIDDSLFENALTVLAQSHLQNPPGALNASPET